MNNREVRGSMMNKIKRGAKITRNRLKDPEVHLSGNPARPAYREERESFNASDLLWAGELPDGMCAYYCALIDTKDGQFGFWIEEVWELGGSDSTRIYIYDNLFDAIKKMPWCVYNIYVKETHPLPLPEGKSAYFRK
jgi:hypothetical protein